MAVVDTAREGATTYTVIEDALRHFHPQLVRHTGEAIKYLDRALRQDYLINRTGELEEIRARCVELLVAMATLSPGAALVVVTSDAKLREMAYTYASAVLGHSNRTVLRIAQNTPDV